MDITLPLLGIAGAMIVGAMSPGPSFVMVARTAVASRSDGLAAALGMGLGGIAFAVAALVGLQAAFLAVPALYLAIKLLGGLYLVYLGIRIWRGAKQPLDVAEAQAPGGNRQPGRRALLLGLATQISNPKTAVVYASIFAAFLPRDVPCRWRSRCPSSSSASRPAGMPSWPWRCHRPRRARPTCATRPGSTARPAASWRCSAPSSCLPRGRFESRECAPRPDRSRGRAR